MEHVDDETYKGFSFLPKQLVVWRLVISIGYYMSLLEAISESKINQSTQINT